MVFQIPENIAPECYPLAWLMDTWVGAGILEYEGIETSGYVHELSIVNEEESPYMRVTSSIWLTEEPAGAVDKEVHGECMYRQLTKERLWAQTVAFVRATPGAGQHEGATLVEAMSASPAGHAMTWAGLIKGPQLNLQADAIAATPTASTMGGARIMAGLVESDLFYAYDMAAFGQPMGTYMAGRLSRVGALDD